MVKRYYKENGEDADAFDWSIDHVMYEWMQDFSIEKRGICRVFFVVVLLVMVECHVLLIKDEQGSVLQVSVCQLCQHRLD